jgi:hypothetical protein
LEVFSSYPTIFIESVSVKALLIAALFVKLTVLVLLLASLTIAI